MRDTFGQEIEQTYSVILTDPNFERRLKAFDPRLKLMFDQGSKRWIVLEWAYDNSGWNRILVAEDKEGNPKPLGEWVFNRLFVYRQRYEAKRDIGVDQWFKNLVYEADKEKEKKSENWSDNHQAMLREDITQWRKASKELKNEPIADATAGYPK